MIIEIPIYKDLESEAMYIRVKVPNGTPIPVTLLLAGAKITPDASPAKKGKE